MNKPLLLVFLLGVYSTPAIAQTIQEKINAGYNELQGYWNNDIEWRQNTEQSIQTACAAGRARKARGEQGLGAYANEQIGISIALKRYKIAGAQIFTDKMMKKICPDAYDARWLK